MICYFCGERCTGEFWTKCNLGKVEVLAAVCKICLKKEVSA